MKQLKDFNTRRELIKYMAEGGIILHRRAYTDYMSQGKIKSLGKTSCVIEFAPPADSIDFITLPEHLQAKPGKAETHDMRHFSIDTSVFNVNPSSLFLSFNPVGNPFSYLSKISGGTHASYKSISDIQNRRELLDLRRKGIVTPEGIRGSLDRVDAKQATIITHMGVSQSFDLPGRLWPTGWKETKRIVIPADATFEILSFRNKGNGDVFIKNGDGFNLATSGNAIPLECMLNIGFCVQTGHIAIHSVRRLSDGEVFTVGDIVYTCPKPELISEFVIAGRDINCRFLGFTNYCNLSDLRKSKHQETKIQANAIGSATPVSGAAKHADSFGKEFASLINKYCAENVSSTPDFILANALCGIKDSINAAILDRDKFYGISLAPGGLNSSSDVLIRLKQLEKDVDEKARFINKISEEIANIPQLRQIKTREEAMNPNITGQDILIFSDGNLKAGGRVRHIGLNYFLIEGCNDAFFWEPRYLTFYVLEMPKPQSYADGTSAPPQGTHGPTGSHTGTAGCSTPKWGNYPFI